MRHWTYLLLLLACLGATVPLELVFQLRVLRRPATLVTALVPGFVIFLAWDLYAIHYHQWSYDPRRTIGVHLPGGVPLEEALFFVIIPVCAVLTFEAVKRCRTPRAPAEHPLAKHSLAEHSLAEHRPAGQRGPA